MPALVKALKFFLPWLKDEEMPQISWKLICCQVSSSGPSGEMLQKELLV